jgi:hypothetical protein
MPWCLPRGWTGWTGPIALVLHQRDAAIYIDDGRRRSAA